MLARIRRAFVLTLFPALTVTAYLWRPWFLDDVGYRQLSIICAAYCVFLVQWAVFTRRSRSEVVEMAKVQREAQAILAGQRTDLQARIDFLTAEREISLILNEDVEFEAVLDKVLSITHHALGGRMDDEIDIYLQEKEGAPPMLRASLRDGNTKFRRKKSEDSLVMRGVELQRLISVSNHGRLELVAPLSSDGEFLGIVRVRTYGDEENLSRNLQELSRFISLAIKTPGLYTRAVEDGLTGLATKRHFINLLDQQIAATQRYGDELTLIMVDVDHFKKVNDTHGHLAGDKVLQGVSAAIRRNVRKGTDQAGFRYGGEELGLLLPKTSLEKAAAVAERLRETIEAKQYPGGIRITASLGVAQLEPGMDRDGIIGKADKALYHAKENGRNQVVIADEIAA